jgi:hypothetical protein
METEPLIDTDISAANGRRRERRQERVVFASSENIMSA